MRHTHSLDSMQMHRYMFHIPFMKGMVFLIIFCALALYLLKSFGYFKLSEKKKLENNWISFIPFFHNYMLGELTGNEMWGFKGSKWILGFGPIVITLLALTGIGLFLSIPLLAVYTVYYFMCLFKLYKEFESDHIDLYMVTSVVLWFMSAIWIFVLGIKTDQPVLNKTPDTENKQTFTAHPYQNHVNSNVAEYKLPEEQEKEINKE